MVGISACSAVQKSGWGRCSSRAWERGCCLGHQIRDEALSQYRLMSFQLPSNRFHRPCLQGCPRQARQRPPPSRHWLPRRAQAGPQARRVHRSQARAQARGRRSETRAEARSCRRCQAARVLLGRRGRRAQGGVLRPLWGSQEVSWVNMPKGGFFGLFRGAKK